MLKPQQKAQAFITTGNSKTNCNPVNPTVGGEFFTQNQAPFTEKKPSPSRRRRTAKAVDEVCTVPKIFNDKLGITLLQLKIVAINDIIIHIYKEKQNVCCFS